MKTIFTPEWKSWIQTNIDNGHDKDHLFNILIDEDFSYDAIKQEMQYEPTPKHEFTEEWQELDRNQRDSRSRQKWPV